MKPSRIETLKQHAQKLIESEDPRDQSWGWGMMSVINVLLEENGE